MYITWNILEKIIDNDFYLIFHFDFYLRKRVGLGT